MKGGTEVVKGNAKKVKIRARKEREKNVNTDPERKEIVKVRKREKGR